MSVECTVLTPLKGLVEAKICGSLTKVHEYKIWHLIAAHTKTISASNLILLIAFSAASEFGMITDG